MLTVFIEQEDRAQHPIAVSFDQAGDACEDFSQDVPMRIIFNAFSTTRLIASVDSSAILGTPDSGGSLTFWPLP